MLLVAAVALPGNGNLSFPQGINGNGNLSFPQGINEKKKKKGYCSAQMKFSVLPLYDVYGTVACLALIK